LKSALPDQNRWSAVYVVGQREIEAMNPIRITRQTVVATVLSLFIVGNAAAKSVSVNKCVGPDRQVLYTDQPCKGAERLEVEAGNANPAATATLARYQDALDQGTAQLLAREARDRSGSGALTLIAPPVSQPFQYDSANPSDPYYVDGFPWGASPPFLAKQRPRYVRPRVVEPRRFLPVPPPVPHR
jgi:hypothetical protein